ncbi:hypothetical protein EDEG_02433 [Edhazardia aedis USNM 41457]|uniref:Uncharacterized protein n=1 Tax=Edhazardia aedis (strain USNM 41457) TaxID=1003232 RepID=J9DKR2_EDHAE|nr:hypothetical protein EDEG_02433 [Edhazardia aedis USNM 41457]|eukprot:EJW03180.1 hypothetical protein EDEG_02433 [Edhazardia aedis USNM 41457]
MGSTIPLYVFDDCPLSRVTYFVNLCLNQYNPVFFESPMYIDIVFKYFYDELCPRSDGAEGKGDNETDNCNISLCKNEIEGRSFNVANNAKSLESLESKIYMNVNDLNDRCIKNNFNIEINGCSIYNFDNTLLINKSCEEKMRCKGFLKENIVNFTKRFLSISNIYKFIKLWSLLEIEDLKDLVDDFCYELILNDVQREFMEAVFSKIYNNNVNIVCLKSHDKSKLKVNDCSCGASNFIRFCIANDFFDEECSESLIFQIRNLVKILKTDSILEKIELLKLQKFVCKEFYEIIKTNCEIFGISDVLNVWNNFKLKENGESRNEHVRKEVNTNNNIYGNNFIENNYFKKLCDLVKVCGKNVNDDLIIREIFNFTEKQIVTDEWCYYFIEKHFIDTFDDFYINLKLFDRKNFDYQFSKFECMLLDKILQEYNEDLIIRLYGKDFSLEDELKNISLVRNMNKSISSNESVIKQEMKTLIGKNVNDKTVKSVSKMQKNKFEKNKIKDSKNQCEILSQRCLLLFFIKFYDIFFLSLKNPNYKNQLSNEFKKETLQKTQINFKCLIKHYRFPESISTLIFTDVEYVTVQVLKNIGHGMFEMYFMTHRNDNLKAFLFVLLYLVRNGVVVGDFYSYILVDLAQKYFKTKYKKDESVDNHNDKNRSENIIDKTSSNQKLERIDSKCITKNYKPYDDKNITKIKFNESEIKFSENTETIDEIIIKNILIELLMEIIPNHDFLLENLQYADPYLLEYISINDFIDKFESLNDAISFLLHKKDVCKNIWENKLTSNLFHTYFSYKVTKNNLKDVEDQKITDENDSLFLCKNEKGRFIYMKYLNCYFIQDLTNIVIRKYLHENNCNESIKSDCNIEYKKFTSCLDDQMINLYKQNERVYYPYIDFTMYIAKVINVYTQKNTILSIKKTETISKYCIDTKESFLLSLLFENKDFKNIISTFYHTKSLQYKYYLPKFYQVYLKRNKIDLHDILNRKYKKLEFFHILNVLVACFDNLSSGLVVTVLDFLKDLTGDNIFYAFLCVLYWFDVFKQEMSLFYYDMVNKICINNEKDKNTNNEIKTHNSINNSNVLHVPHDIVFICCLIDTVYNLKSGFINDDAKVIGTLIKKIKNDEEVDLSLIDYDLIEKYDELIYLFAAEENIDIFKKDATDMTRNSSTVLSINNKGNIEEQNNKIYNIFEAVRIMCKPKITKFADKNGIYSFLIDQIKKDPIFYLQVLIKLDKIPSNEITILETLLNMILSNKEKNVECNNSKITNAKISDKSENISINNFTRTKKLYDNKKEHKNNLDSGIIDEDNKNIIIDKNQSEEILDLIINLLEKHNNFDNYNNLLEKISKSPKIKHSALLLEKFTRRKIFDLLNNPNYWSFFIFESLYKIHSTSFFEILPEYLGTTKKVPKNILYNIVELLSILQEINIKNKIEDKYLCGLYFHALCSTITYDLKFLSNFIHKIKFLKYYDFEYDWCLLKQKDIVSELASEYLASNLPVYLYILSKIAGDDGYFFPLFLYNYKNIQYLLKIQEFSKHRNLVSNAIEFYKD